MAAIHQVARARQKLSGPRGLVTSIIAQAYVDAYGQAKIAQETREEAKAWFSSSQYQHYLNILGLPSDWQPEEYT